MNPEPAVFFDYPAHAQVAMLVPKNKIYDQINAKKRLKTLFVEQVDKIVWQYKLAPETINLADHAAVQEIQIFHLYLKTHTLDEAVLACIDEAVSHPIIFELHYQGQRQTIAAYKRPSLAHPAQRVRSAYFASTWQANTGERRPLPVALDLLGLYQQLLFALSPLPTQPQESLGDWVERLQKYQRLQRDIDKTQHQLDKEKQFNRKMKIHADLRQLKATLAQFHTRTHATTNRNPS